MNADRWQSIVDLWCDRCASRPDQIAVEAGAVRWTYRDLQQRAETWAAAVRDVFPSSSTIAIHLPHDADTIAAVFGILAAGRSFVALDHAHPIEQRIAQLKLCDAPLVICRQEDKPSLSQAIPDAILLTPENLRAASDAPRARIRPDSLAHLAFTSGSSGMPKAVMMPHLTAIAGASIFQSMLHLDASDRHALLSPMAVPASNAQIFGAMCAGATLCLFEARAHSVADLAGWLTSQRITTIQTIPSLLRRLALHADGRRLWPDLRAVKLGGEPALSADAKLFTSCASSSVEIINGFGLTETGFNACWSTWRPSEPLPGDLLPIGRPAPSVEIAVEASPGFAVSDGDIGQIVIRSPALPAGYWNDPAATASAYREIPERPGWRELRTGDAGRWRNDGLLEYAGRLDDVIKIRGHRVVPAEVEAAVLSLSGVEAVAVVLAENVLHAFVQPRPGPPRNSDEFRRNLAAKLPSYMLPGRIHFVESLPRLANGKLDRMQLWKQATAAPQHLPTEALDLPTARLLAIWQAAFGSKHIGINDDFFALGGDSLTAATVLAAVQKFLGINLPGAVLLEAPTVEKLSALIRNGGWQEGDVRLVPLKLGGAKPPLYCVPGAGCDAIQFRALANHLGHDQPVFGFQPRGLDGRSYCQRSIEEMAESYIDTMRQHQSGGPYYLCGSSFGGVVAFEMARRLSAAGDEVAFLGLLDSYVNKYPKCREQLTLRKRIKLAVWNLLPLDAKQTVSPLSLGRGLLHRCMRWLVDLALLLNVRAPRHPYKLRYFYLEETCLRARHRYQPRAFPGKIYLFRAELQPPSDLFEPDPHLGWDGVAGGGIEICDLPGYHAAYLSEPGVAELAEKITGHLAGTTVELDAGRDSKSAPIPERTAAT